MDGGVHDAQLLQLELGEGATPSPLQPVRQHLQRAERRPHVVYELDEEVETVESCQGSAKQLLQARLEVGPYAPHAIEGREHITRGTLARPPQRQQHVPQQIDEMLGQAQCWALCQRVDAGRIATVHGHRGCRENRGNSRDVGGRVGCFTPARLDAANRAREQTAGDLRIESTVTMWIGNALSNVPGGARGARGTVETNPTRGWVHGGVCRRYVSHLSKASSPEKGLVRICDSKNSYPGRQDPDNRPFGGVANFVLWGVFGRRERRYGRRPLGQDSSRCSPCRSIRRYN